MGLEINTHTMNIPKGFVECYDSPKIGDVIFHPKTGDILEVIDDVCEYNLIQIEFYPSIENFGCLHLRPIPEHHIYP